MECTVSRELMRVADLRQLLREMEQDLGLGHLSQTEADVLCAATQKSEEPSGVSVTEIKEHPLVQGMPRATFFRALRNLVELGLMNKVSDEKRAGYIVTLQDAYKDTTASNSSG
jgi:DNA-binding MarR family transcriptional regulator